MSIPVTRNRLRRALILLTLALLVSLSGHARAQDQVQVSLDAGFGSNPFFATENGTATNGLTLRIGTFNSASDADIQALGYNLLWVNNQFTIMTPGTGNITTSEFNAQNGSFSSDGANDAYWTTDSASALNRAIWLVASDNGTLASSAQYGLYSSTNAEWDMPAAYSAGTTLKLLNTTQVDTIAFGSSNGTSSTSSIRTATTPTTFLYWDSNAGAGLGGDGTWSSSTSDTEWTTASGGESGDGSYAWGSTSGTNYYAGAGLTANFGGTAGTVTVSGTVEAHAGMEFATTGYTISSGTVSLSGANATANTITVGTGSATISSVLSGSNGLTKNGAGTLILTANNTYTGSTTISAGTLQIGNGGYLPGNLTTSSIVNNSALVFDIARDPGNSALAAGVNGIISGSGSVTKNGTNSIDVRGANTYEGATIINNGNYRISNSSALGSTAVGTTVNDGATLTLQGSITVSEALSINGLGYTGIGGLRAARGSETTSQANYLGAITLAGSSRINTTTEASLTISGGISGSYDLNFDPTGGNITVNSIIATSTGAITKTGNATLNLSAANSFQGLTTISVGNITASHASALGTTTAGTTVASGAALQLTGGITIGAEALGLNGTGISSGGALRNITGDNTYQGAITLNAASRINSDSGLLTLSGGISGTQNLSIGGAGNITVSGIVGTSSGTLLKDGAGRLILSGANTYTGTTTISAGILQIGAGGTTGSLSTSSTITNNAGLVFNQTDTVTQGTDFSNNIAGSGTLTQNGSGTLALNTSNSYTGATAINAGILRASNATALGTTAAGTTVASGAALELTGGITIGAEALSLSGTGIGDGGALRNISGNNTYQGAITLNAASRIHSDSGELLLTGGVSGTQNLTFGGAGTISVNSTIATSSASVTFSGANSNSVLNLNNANTYSGGTTLNTGTLRIRNSEALGSGNLTQFGSASEFRIDILSTAEAPAIISNNMIFNERNVSNAGNLVTRSIYSATLTGGITLNAANVKIQPNNLLTITGVISGSGGLEISSTFATGLLILTGANTYTGDTTFSHRPLQIGNGGTTGSLSTSSTINNESTLVFNRSNTITQGTDFSAGIRGNGSITQNGTGTLVLNSANTYNGTTLVNFGNLTVAHANALGSTGNGTTVASGAALQLTGGITIGAEALGLSGTGISSGGALKNLSGDNTYQGAITLNAASRIHSDAGLLTLAGGISGTQNLTLGGTGNITVSSVIGTSTGTLTKDGAGLAILSANNTFSGSTTITTGTLQIGAGGGTGSLASSSIVNNSALVVDRTGSLTLSASISGSGNLTKNGSGTLILSGSSNYAGPTTLNLGTLTIQNANALGTGTFTQSNGSSLFTIDTTGTVSNAMSLYNVSALQSAMLSGTITVNNASFDVDDGDTLTLSGGVGGTGGVTKNGTGTLVLSGSNTYSGATVVNAGILNAANANALGTNASVTVNGGSLLVSSDDAINGKNLILASTASGNGTAAGLAFSGSYNGTAGTLTLQQDSIIDLGTGSVVVHFTDLAMGLYNLSIFNWTGTTLWGGGDGNNTDQFYIDRTLTGGELDRISFYSGIDTSSFVGTGYQLSGGSFNNEVIPVPEPETYATALLLLLGAGWCYARQRRRGQPARLSVRANTPTRR